MIYMSDGSKPEKLTWPLLKRVFTYGRPYRRQIGWMLVTILISSGLGLVSPLILRELIDNALPNEDVGLLTVLAVLLMIVPLVNATVLVLQRWLNSAIGEGLIFDLRAALFNHLQRMSLRFFTNTKTGELMSRLNNDVVGAQRAVNTTLVSIVTNTTMVVATLIVMLALEWRLTLLGLMVVPLFIIPARRMTPVLRKITKEQMSENAKMNALMNETLNISGAMLVKLFGRADDENVRFRKRAAGVRDAGVKQAVSGSLFFAFLGLIGAVGTAIVYYIGGRLVLDGSFSIGTIVAFAALLSQLYGPLQALVNAPVDFVTSMISFERVFEILDMPLEVAEKPDAAVLQEVKGAVTFESVSFAYEDAGTVGFLSEVERHGMDSVKKVLSDDDESKPDGKPKQASNGNGTTNGHAEDSAEVAEKSQARSWALDGVSFEIQPGQLVALVGPSGAGKTTITYLLPRLYDPTEGRILIDGNDLREVTLKSLSEQIGMVTQETYLFHDTLRMNLLYAKPDASQDEIEAACRAANIHDFIAGLPEGYETIAGERGYRLSGGEKQRIAIARVLLKNPRILVLDEATSHLDSQSEALIQAALEKVMQGRTSVVIAHRLSTILKADLILVMNRGQVVERGSHTELLAKGGLYTDLYHTQFNREYAPEIEAERAD
ncbi:MAG: ABC transporter ATP-binding protein [Chloroflexi bacterium]|nr:ABC transporter ATP-binding protein [Chloroflexota bacterium]